MSENYNKYGESLGVDCGCNNKLNTLNEFANANSFLFWSNLSNLPPITFIYY